MEARWLTGHPIDVAAYCALVNVQRRLLTTVGLQRRPRDVTPNHADYVAANTIEAVPQKARSMPEMAPAGKAEAASANT